MEFPGITKDLIKDLDPEKQKVIRDHIGDIEALIQKKEDLINNRDPNEKFLEFQGFAQLDKYEDIYKGELHSLIEELDDATSKLTNAVKEEIRLVKEIRRMASAAEDDDSFKEDMDRLKEEIKDEMVIATLLRDQQRELDRIHELASKISHIAPPELGEYAGEFDIIRSLLDNIIKEEFPVLDLIHGLANIPGSNTELPSQIE